MTNPNVTDLDFKQNVQAAFEQSSRTRSNTDALLGREYSIGNLFQDVADLSSVGIYFELPADSNKFAFVDGRFSVTGKWYVQKVDQVTRDVAGTTISPNNRLIGDGQPDSTGEFGATVSGGNEWSRKVIGSASGSGGSISLSAGNAEGSAVILQPGENVYFRAENNTGATADISIDVDWTETPIDEVAELVA